MYIKAGAYGKIKSGKSTILNAILACQMTLSNHRPIVTLPSATLESTALPTAIRVDADRVGRVFGVMYSDGKQTDLPIQALRDFSPPKDAVGLLMYVPADPLLSKLEFIDLPGLGSTVEKAHNAAVADFFDNPAALDILIHVVSGNNDPVATITSAGKLPLPRIICVNKIYERWDALKTPESVKTSAVDGVRNRIAGQPDVIPETIVACSGLAGLASVVWSDTVFAGCLHIADSITAGDFGLLSARQYFGDAEIRGISRKARLDLSEAANASLRGAGNEPSYKPGYPVLRLACGLGARERISTPEQLRQRLYAASGIDALIRLIRAVAESPSVKQRRNLLPWVIQCQNEQHEINRLLGETRMLSETARRMEVEELSSGLAKLEKSNFFSKFRSYMETQEDTLAGRRQAIQRELDRVENDYRQTSGIADPTER